MSMSRHAQNRISDLEAALAHALRMFRTIETGKTFTSSEFYARMVMLEKVHNPDRDDLAALRAFSHRDPATPGNLDAERLL